MTCEDCGKEVKIGDWPFCPHEHMHRFGHAPLDEFDEMISDDGMKFTSWGDKLKYMDRHAIEPKKSQSFGKTARGATGKALFFDMKR